MAYIVMAYIVMAYIVMVHIVMASIIMAYMKATTQQGMLTLASRMYGRGTDFKIFDDRMEACGGMHVLQVPAKIVLAEAREGKMQEHPRAGERMR